MKLLPSTFRAIAACVALLAGNFAMAAIGDPSIRIQTAYTLSAYTHSGAFGGSIGTMFSTQIANLNQAFYNSNRALCGVGRYQPDD